MGSDHYFSDQPAADSVRRTVTLRLPDACVELATDSGVFSPKQIDAGTQVLLDHAPMPAVKGDVLDLGCGYGPIALTIAMQRRRRRVWAVDVNSRALGLVRENAEALGLGNVVAALPDDVPDTARFAAIYSNPPIRVGKAALHDLLLRWLPLLVPGGTAYLVVQRNLGADSLAGWLGERGFDVSRLTSQRGYRLLAVGSAPTDDTARGH